MDLCPFPSCSESSCSGTGSALTLSLDGCASTCGHRGGHFRACGYHRHSPGHQVEPKPCLSSTRCTASGSSWKFAGNSRLLLHRFYSGLLWDRLVMAVLFKEAREQQNKWALPKGKHSQTAARTGVIIFVSQNNTEEEPEHTVAAMQSEQCELIHRLWSLLK